MIKTNKGWLNFIIMNLNYLGFVFGIIAVILFILYKNIYYIYYV